MTFILQLFMNTPAINTLLPSILYVRLLVCGCIFLYVLFKKALLDSKALFSVLPESALQSRVGHYTSL